MKKLLFLTSVFVMLALTAMAVPAKRGQYKVLTLANGTEVKANDNGMSFKFVLAGYKKEDLKIDFERSSLILSTSETFKEPEEDKDVVVSTIKTPMFRYAYSIPITKLDTEKTSAKFEDGILTITIPPLEEGKKKKSVIEIR